MKKIGISMRASHAVGYSEIRDAIARDWYLLFASLGLENNWILLPNLNEDTVLYAKHWGIEALILTGGDDVGQDLTRDNTELALVDYCVGQQFPVLGVCRGAQLIQHFFGGRVVPTDSALHRATRHSITATMPVPWWKSGFNGEVNSYHASKLAFPLPEPLHNFAMAGNECEGVMHKSLPIVGIMWHPEREASLSEFDRALCLWLFN